MLYGRQLEKVQWAIAASDEVGRAQSVVWSAEELKVMGPDNIFAGRPYVLMIVQCLLNETVARHDENVLIVSMKLQTRSFT